MGLGRGGLVLFVDLDGLVTLGGDHAEGAPVELDVEDACLARQGPRLHLGLDLLKVVPAFPVKEVQGAIVCTTNQHIVCVKSQRVYHCIMVWDGSQLVTLWALPEADLVRASRGKCIFIMMQSESAHTFLVMSECLYGTAGSYIPHSDSLIMRASDDLRFISLTNDGFNRV